MRPGLADLALKGIFKIVRRLEAATFYLISVLIAVGLFMAYGADKLLKSLMESTGGTFQYSHVVVLIILAGGVF